MNETAFQEKQEATFEPGYYSRDWDADPWTYAQAEYEDDCAQAPLITVVGASGGVGRSTIALLSAFLAAESGIDTVLIEGDLHFGDFGFWLGLDNELPNLADNPIEPIKIHKNLDLYKAPPFPEFAEDVAESLLNQLKNIRANRGLVIADTGAFWSGLVAGLLVESDLFFMLMDNRSTSIAGAVRASELCSRINVPSSRMIAVYNRWVPRIPITSHEAQKALNAPEILCIPEGKKVVDELMSSGSIEELIKLDNPIVQGARELLSATLPRVGHLYTDAPIEGSKGRLFWHD